MRALYSQFIDWIMFLGESCDKTTRDSEYIHFFFQHSLLPRLPESSGIKDYDDWACNADSALMMAIFLYSTGPFQRLLPSIDLIGGELHLESVKEADAGTYVCQVEHCIHLPLRQ